MKKYIVLIIEGSLASSGSHTTERERPTFPFISYSDMAGKLGVSLGIEGDDYEGRREVAESFRYAVRVERHISVYVDFQTTHGVRSLSDQKRKRIFLFRELMEENGGDPVITKRHYLVEPRFTVLLDAGGVVGYDNFMGAICNPVYSPKLGRRNCFPSRPFMGTEIEADSFMDGFRQISPFAGIVYSPDNEGAYRHILVRDVPDYGSSRFWERKVYVHKQVKESESK